MLKNLPSKNPKHIFSNAIMGGKPVPEYHLIK